MRIYILAGLKSKLIAEEIVKRSTVDVSYSEDLSTGHSEIELSNSIDKIVLFDPAFVMNDRVLNFNDVFKAVGTMANSKCEVLMITSNSVIQNKFIECLYSAENCRVELVESVKSSILVDLIMNKTKPVTVGSYNLVSEEVSEEISPASVATPDVEHSKPASISSRYAKTATIENPNKELPKVEPVVEKQSEPEPVKVESVVENPTPKIKEEPRRSLKSFLKTGSNRNLKEYFTGPKALCVTGNANSGVTSTACEMFNTASNAGIHTVLVDLNLYCLDTTMYYDNLDTGKSSRIEQTGLLSALNNPGYFSEYTNKVNAFGDILGCSSNVSCSIAMGQRDLYEKISDLISALTTEYTLVIVNLPYSLLEQNIGLVKDFDSICYCTNCSINGLYNIRHNLGLDDLHSDDRVRKMNLLYRKLSYVLCNVSDQFGTTINVNNFLTGLADFCQTSDYSHRVAGTIPHYKGFDNFKSTKTLFSDKDDTVYKDIIISSLFR